MGQSVSWRHLRRVIAPAAAVCVFLAAPPAGADDIPVVQGDSVTPGADGRQQVTPPGEGFTDASASSSSPTASVDPPTVIGGSWGVNFKVGMPGVSVVTVTWKNPKTGEVRRQYFVVACGWTVDTAESATITEGANVGTNVAVPKGGEVSSSNTSVGGASVNPEGNLVLAGGHEGTTVVSVNWKDDQGHYHLRLIIVTVAKKPAPAPPKPAAQPSTPKPEKEGGGD